MDNPNFSEQIVTAASCKYSRNMEVAMNKRCFWNFGKHIDKFNVKLLVDFYRLLVKLRQSPKL